MVIGTSTITPSAANGVTMPRRRLAVGQNWVTTTAITVRGMSTTTAWTSNGWRGSPETCNVVCITKTRETRPFGSLDRVAISN